MPDLPERMPPLNWLRSFEASARLGSYTAAAKELNITQSAVSQQIRLLESYLHEALFFREGRRMRLTEAGINYTYFVHEAFDLIRIGTSSVFDKDRGQSVTLRSNLAFTLYWLMPRLGDLYQQHPWINLNILPHIWDDDTRQSSIAIEILCGINYAEQGYRPLRAEHFFPVCAPDLMASGRVEEVPHFNGNSMTATWKKWHHSGLSPLKAKPVNYSSTMVVALTAATNGAGLALSHTSLFGAAEAAGQLVRPFEGELLMQERYFMSELKEHEQTPATRCFLDWVNQQMEI